MCHSQEVKRGWRKGKEGGKGGGKTGGRDWERKGRMEERKGRKSLRKKYDKGKERKMVKRRKKNGGIEELKRQIKSGNRNVVKIGEN